MGVGITGRTDDGLQLVAAAICQPASEQFALLVRLGLPPRPCVLIAEGLDVLVGGIVSEYVMGVPTPAMLGMCVSSLWLAACGASSSVGCLMYA